jgi:hypothetical protein
MPEMKTLTIGSEKFDIRDETAVHSWEEIPDKPFSKEVDSSVYTTSTFGQLESPMQNAEDYTHGTSLCVTNYMPGSVTVTVDGFVTNKSVPLVPIDQYYALGKFEINGRKFGIYSAYNGSGYALFVLGMSSDGLYGQMFRISDIAKINCLPTEYINVTDLRNNFGTWATMPDKPFAVKHYDLGARLNIKDFRENTSNDNVIDKEKYPYISSLVSVLDYRPDWVTFYAYGSHPTIAIRAVNDAQYIGHDVSAGSFNGTVYIEQKTDGYHVYFLSKNMVSATMGYLESAAVANPLDIRALPIREIAFKVKEILGL